MIVALCAVIALVSILMSGIFSGAETGLYCMNRLRVSVMAREGDVSAGRLVRLVENEHQALSALLVGTNVFNYVVTVCLAYLLVRLGGVTGRANELYATLITTPVIFVFAEVVPKALFERHSDPLMLRASPILAIFRRVFSVPVTVLGWISAPIIRWIDPIGITAGDPRGRVTLMLHDALATDDDDSDKHRALVDGVLQLRSVKLHEVMTPRQRVVRIRLEASRAECVRTARRNAHSRLPVYDQNPRRIAGTVQVHRVLAGGEHARVRDYLEPTLSLSAQQTVASALVLMQQKRVRMAIVTDRSGLMLGIVTLKDLLEELTGELHAW